MKRLIKLAVVFALVGCLVLVCSSEKIPSNQTASSTGISDNAWIQQTDTKQRLMDDIFLSRQNAITRAVADVSPAIVGIKVKILRQYYRRDPFFDLFFRRIVRPETSLGSGFLISSEGYILTNQHVINNGEEIQVTLSGGEHYIATLIGEDKTYDVALLKIDGADFPHLSLGNSDDVIIGEWVIALGNPFGLFDISSKPTVTVGVVSATEMNFGDTNITDGRSYQHMIQTDASINSGNSGGALVNSLGQCIGINTFIFTGDQSHTGSVGIGFAIPINRVKKILPDLESIGYVDRSFKSGLVVDDLNAMVASMLGISPGDGVIISQVAENSPAHKAKLKVGDVIVAINGTRVGSTSDARHITSTIDIRENPNMELKIYRNGKLQDVKLELE